MTSDDHDHKHCLEMFQKLSEFIDEELIMSAVPKSKNTLITALPASPAWKP